MLIEQCRSGATGAWDQLFDLHYGPVSRFLHQLIPDGTPEEILEVSQDTFLAAIRNLGSFTGRSRVGTWLFRIAATKAREYRDRRLAMNRGSGRAPVLFAGGLRVSSQGHGWPPCGLPRLETPPADEATLEVRRALDLMGGSCREIIELRYFGDFDDETLGAALGLDPRMVSSRLSRCLGKLGELLSQSVPATETTAKPV